MARVKVITGNKSPKTGEANIYEVIREENTTPEDYAKVSWQLYLKDETGNWIKHPKSPERKENKAGAIQDYAFGELFTNQELLLTAFNEKAVFSEPPALKITPIAGDPKITKFFFTDLTGKTLEEIFYNQRMMLQIHTVGMLGKKVNYSIYYDANGTKTEVRKGQSKEIIKPNGVVNPEESFMIDMPIRTGQSTSADEHHFKIKIWETGNEANFLEQDLKIKNQTVNQMSDPETQVPITTGTSEQPKKKEDNKKKETCGIQYRNSITCVKYGSKNPVYGPLYSGSIKLAFYKKWNEIVSSGKVTVEEKQIILAMSENEGNMDAVQSYDSEILTAGAMQKTINPEGYGELSIQLWEFKQSNPDKFKELFENCGWDVKEIETLQKDKKVIKKYQAYYNDKTGKDLKILIRKGFVEKKYKEKVICIPMESFINACKDEDFQAKQIIDFISRLNSAINKKPTGYSNKIKDFTKSKLGKAMVLDHDVNRPGHVMRCFGDALDKFFNANKKVSRNPADWKENHNVYETQILEIYGPLRGQGDYTMTDANGRYIKLKSRL